MCCTKKSERAHAAAPPFQIEPASLGCDLAFYAERILSYVFKLFQVAQRRANIGIEQDGLSFKSSHGDGLTQIDADIGGPGILRRHAQERDFDDAGGITADAQFQKQDTAVSMPMQEMNAIYSAPPSSVITPVFLLFVSNDHTQQAYADHNDQRDQNHDQQRALAAQQFAYAV